MVTPIPLLSFQLPELPDKDYQMHKANNRRLKDFYERYPEGHMEILPSPTEVYEYYTIDKKHKIVFQVIKTGEDPSFFEGNFKEYLVFYLCEKVPVSFPLFREWFKKEWAIRNEIPIEIIEEQFNIPFREQWYYGNKYRSLKFKERILNTQEITDNMLKTIYI